MVGVLHPKTKAEIDAMPDDEFEEYLVWFKDANREAFKAKDQRREARDALQLAEIVYQAKNRAKIPLSKDNPKVIPDETYQRLIDSGLTDKIECFVPATEKRKRQ